MIAATDGPYRTPAAPGRPPPPPPEPARQLGRFGWLRGRSRYSQAFGVGRRSGRRVTAPGGEAARSSAPCAGRTHRHAAQAVRSTTPAAGRSPWTLATGASRNTRGAGRRRWPRSTRRPAGRPAAPAPGCPTSTSHPRRGQVVELPAWSAKAGTSTATRTTPPDAGGPVRRGGRPLPPREGVGQSPSAAFKLGQPGGHLPREPLLAAAEVSVRGRPAVDGRRRSRLAHDGGGTESTPPAPPVRCGPESTSEVPKVSIMIDTGWATPMA